MNNNTISYLKFIVNFVFTDLISFFSFAMMFIAIRTFNAS